MTQEDKNLLIQDIASRLLYGVRCSFGVDDAIYQIEGINPNCCGASQIQATHIDSHFNGDFNIDALHLYLFPLSSMTDEQKKELRQLHMIHEEFGGFLGIPNVFISHSGCLAYIDWCVKNHFDYRGLIPRGIAKDATNKNIY